MHQYIKINIYRRLYQGRRFWKYSWEFRSQSILCAHRESDRSGKSYLSAVFAAYAATVELENKGFTMASTRNLCLLVNASGTKPRLPRSPKRLAPKPADACRAIFSGRHI